MHTNIFQDKDSALKETQLIYNRGKAGLQKAFQMTVPHSIRMSRVQKPVIKIPVCIGSTCSEFGTVNFLVLHECRRKTVFNKIAETYCGSLCSLTVLVICAFTHVWVLLNEEKQTVS